MRTCAFHSLGCKVNSYETEVMQASLEKIGFRVVAFEETADVYIVNTCTVTNMADRKSRQMLHRAKNKNPQAIVVAVGCYVQAAGEELLKDSAVDIIIGNNRKNKLAEILLNYMDGEASLSGLSQDIYAENEYEPMTLVKTAEHTRAFIKVQDGCNLFCTYCLIPYVRGRIRSQSPQAVAKEVKGLVQAGYQEVVLNGIHLSSYGKDQPPVNGQRPDLKELVLRLNEIQGLKRIRLGSLEPGVINESFIDALKQCETICPHFHLSLQSGCDETLKRMNRHYTSSQYYEKCLMLREHFEHPALTTDLIAGFPGETEDEFNTTYEFVKKVHFFEMHVFKYSKRKGTKAADMPDQVPENQKSERSKRLMELAGAMSADFRQYYLGRQVQVLTEETETIEGESCLTGHTKEYVKIWLPKENQTINQLVTATPKSLHGSLGMKTF